MHVLYKLLYSDDSLIRAPIDSPELSLIRTKVWEQISTSGLMGDSVIWKTRLSGTIDREQTCPDKRIITALFASILTIAFVCKSLNLKPDVHSLHKNSLARFPRLPEFLSDKYKLPNKI